MRRDQPYSFPVQSFMLGTVELIFAYAIIVALSVFVLHIPPLFAAFIYFIVISMGVFGGRALLIRLPRVAVIISILCGMLITVTSFMLWSTGNNIILIVTGVITGGIATYRGFYLQKYMEHSFSISVKYQLFGLLTLVMLSLLIGKVPQLTESRVSVYLCGLAGFTLFIWTRHTQEMRKVSLDPEGHKPLVRSFARLNHHRILIFLVIVLILGTFQRLSEVAGYLWSVFTAWLRKQFGGEPPQETIPASPDIPEAPPMIPDQDKLPSETSPLWEWLMEAIVVIAIVAFLGFILFKIWRKLQKLYQYFDGRKGKAAPAVRPKQAYIDIVESIEERPKKNWFRFFQRTTVPTDPQARVRYYYQEYVQRARGRGYKLPSHLTPFEMKHELDKINAEAAKAEKTSNRHKGKESGVPEDLFPIYNEVRYGERKVSSEALNKMDKDWKTHQ